MAKRMSIGQKLQVLRKAAGMSQAALAKAAGIPVGTLRNWEQDIRSPWLPTISAVAKVLRVSLDEFFAHVEPKKPRRPRKARTSTRPTADVEGSAKKRNRSRKK